MSDDQDQLPGFGEGSKKPTRRTLRDLVDDHSDNQTARMGTFITTQAPSTGERGKLRLGFPSSEQLARFVAGQFKHLFENLDLPRPLRLVAGGSLERRRFFAGGRVAAPDLLLAGPTEEMILVYARSPIGGETRLPDQHSLQLVESLGHRVAGVLVTPEPDAENRARIEKHLATFEGPPMQWVTYKIELEVLRG